MSRLGPFSDNTIVVGDCLDIMAQMPDGTMDLIFADPPFNVGKNYGCAPDQIIWKHQANGVYKRTFWPLYQPLLMYGKTTDYKFNRYAQRRLPTRRWGSMTTQAQGQMGDLWLDIPFVWAGSQGHIARFIQPKCQRG